MQDLLIHPEMETATAGTAPRPAVAASLRRPSRASLPVVTEPTQPGRSWRSICGVVLRMVIVVPLLAAAIGLAVLGFLPILIAVGALFLFALAPLFGAGVGVLAADELERTAGNEAYQI
jgi:hypothetical protein